MLFFLCTAFRQGWLRSETDFPNYYTAARAVRQGAPLPDLYDWTWFQRQMNDAGIEHQLGAYTPQTPLTMLPIMPLTGLSVQTAKRIWLLANLCFLAVSVWLLSRLSGVSAEYVTLLALAGFTSLRTNFLLGQYYVFLLFLLTLTFSLSQRKRPVWSGITAGTAFALKLYGAPLLLFFAAKRSRKAVASMLATCVAATALAVALFGWNGVYFYATQILARSLESAQTDPYSPGVPAFATLLLRLFVPEAQLNPNPLFAAPWLFFFLHSLFNLAILVFTSLAVFRNPAEPARRSFALFVIASLLLSTSIGSYTYVLLLLPIALCLAGAGTIESLYLVASYVVLNAPLPAGRLFPKVWCLLALFFVIGRNYWTALSPRLAGWTLASIAICAALQAQRATAANRNTPSQRNQLVAAEKGSLFAGYPVVTRAGLFFQAQARDRYILRWLHDGTVDDLSFDGNVFHPFATAPAGLIYFELVSHGQSRMMQFDPATKRATILLTATRLPAPHSTASADSHKIVFTSNATGSNQIYLKDSVSGRIKQVTAGNCNNSDPAWDLDGKSIVFTSDCWRAIGLPALYRMSMENVAP